jgi:hypothetical protein
VKSAKFVRGMLSVLFVLPIWFYLLYKILDAVQASDLMWFLYIAYIPAAMLAALLGMLIEDK